MHYIQHSFICHLSDSLCRRIEPGTVASFALVVYRSHPQVVQIVDEISE
jgi:hypothetical protein